MNKNNTDLLLKELKKTDEMLSVYQLSLPNSEIRKHVGEKREELRALTSVIQAHEKCGIGLLSGYVDKRSALHSLMRDIATEYPFLMNYEDKNEILTYFATLLMDYSNHDRRDVELRLEEVEHLYKIRWCLIADHEILDCGDYIIDKDVPF